MNNLYNRIYKAVNEGVLKSLIITDTQDQDVSVTWQKTDIAKHMEIETKKLQQISQWENLDINKAFAYELHVNDTKLFPNIYKKCRLTSFHDQERILQDSRYIDLPFLEIDCISVNDVGKMCSFFFDTQWKVYDPEQMYNAQLQYEYETNMAMLKSIYTPFFMQHKFQNMYISFDNSMLAIIYSVSGGYGVDIIMGCIINDNLLKVCNQNENDIKKDILFKYLKQLKLQNAVKKCGFIPLFDDKGNLYYETYFIGMNKKQLAHNIIFFNAIEQTSGLTIVDDNYQISEHPDVAVFKKIPEGTLWIKQFTEQLSDHIYKFGWKIFIQ